MPVLEVVLTLVLSVVLPPFLTILVIVLLLASLGKSLGLRKKYVKFLLKVFEFGRKRLADADKKFPVKEINEESDMEGCNGIVSSNVKILCPSIKLSWNFLTRTNTQYEFVSIRLTIFWVVGFMMRYFILLPIRLAILGIGASSVVVLSVCVGFIPECSLRQWFSEFAFVSSFRILSRAISCIIFYHDKENRPRKDGICVANHTSPIDCVVLSCDSCYSFMNFLVILTYIVGCFPDGKFKKAFNQVTSVFCFDFLGGALSLVCTYHNPENLPNEGICVANHTTPIDVLVLACNSTYDLVGQHHSGFLGIFQWALSRASSHIWFERSEVKDRFAVAKRLSEHVEDPNKLPILIFPEGTCINNTSVMQFKKGTFEVGGTIYPVAIKYDPRFGDAFWNSSKYSMLHYIYLMMTSWAIVCDVWYLPPMTIKEGESSIDFANRVKSEIARQGGLVDLAWDGALKRSAPKKEWRELYQQDYSRTLRTSESSNRVKSD